MEDSSHESVLLHEVIEMLDVRDGDVVLDATLNGGGHSEALLRKARITLVGLDLDRTALARAKPRLDAVGKGKVFLRQSNFRDFEVVLDSLGIAEVDKAVFDLGLSSHQLESSGRGFSFKRDEPLYMTMNDDTNAGLTASDIVNEWDEEDIANVLFGYGEERYARRIAKAIVLARDAEPITTSKQLAVIIANAVPKGRPSRVHPATKSFQALRIAANDELGNIREVLPKLWGKLAPKGRIAVISFHSLEDRIVKHTFRTLAERGGLLLTKKPLVPTDEEIQRNPRARSAKLRVIEKEA